MLNFKRYTYLTHKKTASLKQTLFLDSSQKVKCINDQEGKLTEYWVKKKKKMALLDIYSMEYNSLSK